MMIPGNIALTEIAAITVLWIFGAIALYAWEQPWHSGECRGSGFLVSLGWPIWVALALLDLLRGIDD
ncbi:MAG: hypothetical protein AAGB19_01545 [Cyanobacteria bacterium P01_F01_bin.3]